MSRLAETIAGWFGRVEVVLAGVEGYLRDGEEALARGDAMAARRSAKAMLQRVPHSPLGLALLADACEAAKLDAELALTLEELASRVGSRAEVWVRLGRARERVGAPIDEARDAFLRALAVAEAGSDARREALLWLADRDLANGDGDRAELWLERLGITKDADVQLRRAEARLLQDDLEGAKTVLAALEADPTDARAALVQGRVLAATGDAAAFPLLVRAMVLEARGASEALASALAWIPTDEATRARIRTVVAGRGESEGARWRAAFARAEGRRDEARTALVAAVRSGDVSAARPLLDAALEDRDHAALAVALGLLSSQEKSDTKDAAIEEARLLPSPARLRDAGEASAILDELGGVSSPRARAWADAARAEALATWVPPSGAPSDWTKVLTRLDLHARGLHALDATAKVAELAMERSRPVRVAIVGEFNAGKSTFINAVIGADVAPTGVLPTTATLHHLRYAPDPFARIQLHDDAPGEVKERIVPSSELRAALKSAGEEHVKRVEILQPIASLTRVEILDTPGFNAPDLRHTVAARSAFEEADAAIWLLDAGQPLKQTELRILDEARVTALPVQLLVNKADRLKPADLDTVMANVHESLAETGLTSWAPPLALSARLALSGKLGDEDALAKSNWENVQKLLDEQLVGRSVELKERGLRRRAARVVTLMLERAREHASDERAKIDAARARAQELALRAASLEREADQAAQVVAGALTAPAAEWKHDLDVVVTGRDREQAANDPTLIRYRIDRARDRLAPPLAKVLASIAMGQTSTPVEGARADDLLPVVHAAVRTFAATNGKADALLPLTRSAIASLVEHLMDLAAAPPIRGQAEGRVAELEAFLKALEPRS
ncbi:MAG: dynamin family protein [Labilithrix sp.]|nr:dynamin family protein [Labilithrix sp.]MCW5814388.1 dynamin family protein [Labilithrix sp.]